VSSPTLNISASGSTEIRRSTLGKSSNSDAHPLFTAGFTRASISQSSIRTGAFNTISVLLTSTLSLSVRECPTPARVLV
jgi:hypothetical protein